MLDCNKFYSNTELINGKLVITLINISAMLISIFNPHKINNEYYPEYDLYFRNYNGNIYRLDTEYYANCQTELVIFNYHYSLSDASTADYSSVLCNTSNTKLKINSSFQSIFNNSNSIQECIEVLDTISLFS